MIGRIKNVWLRRAILVLTFVPVMLLALLMGAVAGLCDHGSELLEAWLSAWSR